MTIKINLPENPDDFFWLTGYSPDGAIECLPYHYGLISVRSYASDGGAKTCTKSPSRIPSPIPSSFRSG